MSTDNELRDSQNPDVIPDSTVKEISTATETAEEAAGAVVEAVEDVNNEAAEMANQAADEITEATRTAEAMVNTPAIEVQAAEGELKSEAKKEGKTGRIFLYISIVLVILAIIVVIAALIISSSMKKKGRVSQDASVFESVSAFFSGEDKTATVSGTDSTGGADSTVTTVAPTKAAEADTVVDITATPDTTTAEGSAAASEVPTFDVKTILGQYKGIEVDYMDTTVLDSDIEAGIQSFLQTKAEKVEVTDRPCQTSDTVNIDYVGKLDGVPFDRGSAEGVDLQLGSGSMIPGFEDGIIGHSIGETFVIDVTFPENYSSEMAGKAATFDITIHSITGLVIPEFTDEFVAANSEFTNMADYTENLKASLQAEKISAADDDASTNILLKVIDNCTFEGQIEEEVNYGVEAQRSYYDSMANTYYGVDGATLFMYFYGITSEQYDEMLYQQSVFSTKITHVFEEIIMAENITYTAEEYQTKFGEIFYDTYGFSDEAAVYQSISEEEAQSLVIDQLLKDKAQSVILDSAIINGK